MTQYRNPHADIEERVAALLADKDGWIVDEESWERAASSLRRQYLALAREVITLVKGPTLAAQAISNLGAEIRALTKERDRYRGAWRNACTRASRERRAREA
jgi:hypothetical protein